MTYSIEYAQDPSEGFYAEFEIVDCVTKKPIPIGARPVDHQLNVYSERRDYGEWSCAQRTLASNANGLILTYAPNVLVVNIPRASFWTPVCDYGSRFSGWRHTMKCKLQAVPGDPTLTKTIADITISFGDKTMSPRIRLGAYPMYPGFSTSPQVVQLKQVLASQGTYDTVEAALTAGPTDPATLAWNSGGPITIENPLSTLIMSTLSLSTYQMQALLDQAEQLPI